MPRKIKRYGWRRDLPDHRDIMFTAPSPITAAALPVCVDLRQSMPPVYDQGDVGSCTGNSTAAAMQFEHRKQGLTPDFVPSRLFVYWNAREAEGDTDVDGGAQIRDAVKGVAKYGAPPETDWPYEPSQVLVKPSDAAYANAKDDLAINYRRVVQTNFNLRSCLASGVPFIFGFTVYESFESDPVAQTGTVPMPGTDEGVLGGHAVLGVGYDNDNRVFIVRNSWGAGRGKQGYFTMPYAYLDGGNGLASDFWQVSKVSAPAVPVPVPPLA